MISGFTVALPDMVIDWGTRYAVRAGDEGFLLRANLGQSSVYQVNWHPTDDKVK